MKKSFILFVVVFTLLGSCGLFQSEPEVEYLVEYEVTGTVSNVTIQIRDKNEEIRFFRNQSLPWTYSFTRRGDDHFFLSISAWNEESPGSVIVKIYVDGKVTESDTSVGDFDTVTANDSLN